MNQYEDELTLSFTRAIQREMRDDTETGKRVEKTFSEIVKERGQDLDAVWNAFSKRLEENMRNI